MIAWKVHPWECFFLHQHQTSANRRVEGWQSIIYVWGVPRVDSRVDLTWSLWETSTIFRKGGKSGSKSLWLGGSPTGPLRSGSKLFFPAGSLRYLYRYKDLDDTRDLAMVVRKRPLCVLQSYSCNESFKSLRLMPKSNSREDAVWEKTDESHLGSHFWMRNLDITRTLRKEHLRNPFGFPFQRLVFRGSWCRYKHVSTARVARFESCSFLSTAGQHLPS